MDITVTEVLVAITIALVSYLILQWWKDPLRKIPGPTPLPLLGNVLAVDQKHAHAQLYEWAKQYGPVMTFTIFNKPFVVVNTIDACLEAKLKSGEDFLGRPHFPRLRAVLKTDVAFMDHDNLVYPVLRRVTTNAIRSYGPGMVQLEKLIQEGLQDTVEDLNNTRGQTVDSLQLCNNFVCNVIVSLIYGDRADFDASIYDLYKDMNKRMIAVCHPIYNDPILDLYPFFFKYTPFFFGKTCQFIDDTKSLIETHIHRHIQEAKAQFDEDNMRGCLDHFIKAQKEELDSEGKPLLSDDHILGLMVVFVVAGMETSFGSLSQAILDFVHDKPLVKRIQAQIDANFESAQVIKYSDREKLPLLQAYIHENLRILSQVPALVPSCTMRDTEVGGYKIPAGTRVFLNAFNTAHNPDVYPEPFECRPDRFLDENGEVVPPGHPIRRNFIGFGVGTRHCPGETLARTRIFLFLAHILQKFDIEPVGDVPERDVRKYEMGVIVQPPSVGVKFTLRKCVD